MTERPDLFAAMAKRMDWLGQRQRVLARNVSNADTPGFRPHDLTEGSFERLLSGQAAPVEPVATQARHMAGTAVRDGSARSQAQGDPYETAPTGNAVVLEEQLIKVSKTQGAYQLMTNLYRKHMEMFRIAVRGGN